MRIVVATDKFKGTLTGADAAEAMRRGALDVSPNAEVIVVPLADGGEGTVAAAIAAGAIPHEATVSGPLGGLVQAGWASRGATAYLELAEAAGLHHVAHPSPATAAKASTFGLGQLIAAVVAAGHRDLVIGLGGSATTDGGAGALAALGLRLLDSDGADVVPGGVALQRLARIDGEIQLTARIRLACDVDNPLLGEGGAAAVYGPQKGADAATVAALENGLRRFADVARLDVTQPGGGAAGGTAAGLVRFLDARIEPGVQTVLDLAGFDRASQGADAILTGEGSLDRQSLRGKAPIGVVQRAAGIPVAVIAGRIDLTGTEILAAGFAAAVALTDVAGDPMRDAATALREAAAVAVRRLTGEPTAAPG